MSVSLGLAGSGHSAPIDLFESPASQQGQVAEQAARENPRTERPHQELAQANAAAVIGLFQATSIAKGLQLANDIAARNAAATGSVNGPAGVSGPFLAQLGLATIRQGIADLSGHNGGRA